MPDLRLIQITLELWGAFFTLVSAVTAFLGGEFERKKSNLLAGALLATTLLLINDALAWGFSGNASLLGFYMVRISNFMVFAMTPSVAAFIMSYLVAQISSSNIVPNPKWHYAVHGLCCISLMLAVLTPFTDLLYYFDENNVYHRTGNYWTVAVSAAIMLVLLVAMVFCYRKYISIYHVIVIAIYALLPFSTNLFQLFHYGLSLNNIAITIAVLLIFLTFEVEKSRHLVQQKEQLNRNEMRIAEQKLQLTRKDAEIARKKLQISISQMQPHFIFNVLGCIEQLCKIDSRRAAEATHQFARYLRINLNSLSSSDLVWFQDELQHIHTYIWLEKMRFGDDLDYSEDIRTDFFMLPALVVQPLVENAIKHGMMGSEEGVVHILLSTEELEDCYQITVCDDGIGFDPNQVVNDGRAHVGLTNVKERIRLMLHGTVEIRSAIGEGTEVTIRIPKTAMSEDEE